MEKYKKLTILLFVISITVIGCVYALKWHAVYKEDMLNTTIITDYINELKIEEFTNYISDNPYSIIYFGVTSDYNCRRFEKDLKKFVVNKDLREIIVYMNVNELTGNNFETKLDNLFNTKNLREENKYLEEVPAIAIYNHTTLLDFVSDSDLTIENVEQLLNKYNFDGE